ncbi:MAG: Nif3-like dinuclear metal center hexameric protein [Acidimicrobiia bacterium]|nr:Nif3-like dinuclear metal center hexameric protein [Acidimicrobiia bacterium]
MRVQDLLSSLVPAGKAAAWDPVGVQIGDPAADVQSVAVCHEVTEAVVAAVIERPPDLLVTYHPLLFHPTTALVAGRSAAGRALRLARAGVNLAVVHTAFDVAAGGAADALAATAGIESPDGFGRIDGPDAVKVVTFVPPDYVEQVYAAMSTAGGGSIGRYSGCSFRSEGVGTFLPDEAARPAVGSHGELSRESEIRLEMVAPESRIEAVVAALAAVHPYEEPAYDIFKTRSNGGFVGRFGRRAGPIRLGALARELEQSLPATAVRVAGDMDSEVTVVAVVPGSGGDLTAAAASVCAAVIVTGDVSHHQTVQALDRGLFVIDAGHAPTERPGMRQLYAAVAGLGVTARDLTNLNTDPWGR